MAMDNTRGKQKPDINKIIYNDRFEFEKHTLISDNQINYQKPVSTDYRKKRTEILYPNYDESCVTRKIKTEYKKVYKEPASADYRKKRTEILYPNYPNER